MKKHYYAKQSPRGFANEVIVHRFLSRVGRDKWVAAHASDGDMNSATRGADIITAREAREIIGYQGDEITDSYNGIFDHDVD